MTRVLVDTQIFIEGHLTSHSPEAVVLTLLHRQKHKFTLLLSSQLQEQIQNVGKRVGGKDWSGTLINRLWHDFEVDFITLPHPLIPSNRYPHIPKEDLVIFLTALHGRANIMISENHEFVRRAAEAQNLFTCLKAAEFLAQYNSQ
ncbi:MAG: hypothetical protein IPL28_27735 [Chloroflexi bacterium]|nr:hypothetical protein [Chloroflexota bacterium]